jgi:hypothetical protein
MKKQKTISFRLPADLFDRLDQVANMMGANKSEIILKLVQESIKRMDREMDEAYEWAGMDPYSLDPKALKYYTARFAKFFGMVYKGDMEKKSAEAHIKLEGEMYRERMKNG